MMEWNGRRETPSQEYGRYRGHGMGVIVFTWKSERGTGNLDGRDWKGRDKDINECKEQKEIG